jgi:hypothetical protein
MRSIVVPLELTVRPVASFAGVSIRDAICSPLALRTSALEYISAVRTIDVTAAWLHAFHSVRHLAVICSSNVAMTATLLLVAIQVTNRCCLSSAVDKLWHCYFS